jgi:type II secretory pathway component PulF
MTTRFRYRAATSEGRVVEGQLEAASRQGLLDELHRRSLYPMTLEEVTAAGPRGRGYRVGRRSAVALWTRDMATLLDAGLPLDRALGVTTEHASHEALSEALREVRAGVRGGASLADALRLQPRLFPPVLVAMVSSGEASGALDTVFGQIADHLEENAELRSQIRSALTYPALMAAVACIGVTVLLLFVVPRFSTMLAEMGGELPLTTTIVVTAGELLTGWWWVWLGLIGLAGYSVVRLWRDPEVRAGWHARRLRWPWVGDFERKLATARFVRTLGLLLQSGVPIVPSLKIARNAVGNAALATTLDRATASVAEGSALAPALRGALPPLAIQMLAVGEESGRLEEVCARVAGAYDREVRRTLRSMVSYIEPAMILLFGVIVGFVALAMLQAIYSINTAF